jgi:hypothetical protein
MASKFMQVSHQERKIHRQQGIRGSHPCSPSPTSGVQRLKLPLTHVSQPIRAEPTQKKQKQKNTFVAIEAHVLQIKRQETHCRSPGWETGVRQQTTGEPP